MENFLRLSALSLLAAGLIIISLSGLEYGIQHRNWGAVSIFGVTAVMSSLLLVLATSGI